MATRSEFVMKYEAMFGPWPGHESKDTAGWWFKDVIDRMPDGRVEAFLKALQEAHGRRRGEPRLGLAIKVAEGYIVKLDTEDNTPRVECGACGYTGVIVLPAAYSRNLKRWVFDDDMDPNVLLHEVAFPCRCPLGRTRRKYMFPDISEETVNQAWAAFVVLRELCGYEDSPTGVEPQITRREYLKNPRRGTSYRTLVHNMIKASNKKREIKNELGSENDTAADAPEGQGTPEVRKGEGLRDDVHPGGHEGSAVVHPPRVGGAVGDGAAEDLAGDSGDHCDVCDAGFMVGEEEIPF